MDKPNTNYFTNHFISKTRSFANDQVSVGFFGVGGTVESLYLDDVAFTHINANCITGKEVTNYTWMERAKELRYIPEYKTTKYCFNTKEDMESYPGHIIQCEIPNPKDNKHTFRHFRVFRTLDMLITFYLDSVRNPKYDGIVCFYESVRGSVKSKFYLDVDISYDSVKDYFTPDEFIDFGNEVMFNLMKHIMKKWVILTKREFKLNLDVIILSASNDLKRSYHLIFPCLVLPNYASRKTVYNFFMDGLDDNYVTHVDKIPYTSFQQFRFIWSDKAGRKRPLQLLNEWDFLGLKGNSGFNHILKHSEEEKFNRVGDKLIFKECMLTCMTNSHYTFYIPNEFLVKSVKKMKDLNLVEEWDIPEVSVDKIPEGFELGEFNGVHGTFFLKRISASMCPKCKRVHENQNGFLSYSEIGSKYQVIQMKGKELGGKFTFHCYQELEGGGVVIDHVLSVGNKKKKKLNSVGLLTSEEEMELIQNLI